MSKAKLPDGSITDWDERLRTVGAIELSDDELIAELAAKITDDELDDEVHDAASQIASRVNNDGVEAQIQFLIEQWGVHEVVNRILR